MWSPDCGTLDVNGVRPLGEPEDGCATTSREIRDLGGGLSPQKGLNRRLNARGGWFVEAGL